MKFSIKDFFSKRDQIRSKLRIWSHLLEKSLMEAFIFCAVYSPKCKKTPKLSCQALQPGNKKENASLALSIFYETFLAASNWNFSYRTDKKGFLHIFQK